MSKTKIPLAEALELALQVKKLLASVSVEGQLCATMEGSAIAGSIRRQRPEVGDVELVVIPAYNAGRNLLWDRMDLLVQQQVIHRAKKQDGKTRWGAIHRAFELAERPGFHFEVFSADRLNWGSILTIRTGSAEYSQELMTRIKRSGQYRQDKGYIRRVIQTYDEKQGIITEIVPCPDEETMFRLAGMNFVVPPEQREIR